MDNFQDTPAEPETDWALSLPRDAFYEIIRVLRGALPPPDTDAPEDWERRDRAAMAAVGALLPSNAAEARLAALFVKAEAWAADCLRQAVECRGELEVARKCKAQALSMMREAKSAWRLLLKAQAERRLTDRDEAASNRAAWIEHCAVGMMRQGLEAAAAVTPATAAEPAPATRSEEERGVEERGVEERGAEERDGAQPGGEDQLPDPVGKFGFRSADVIHARKTRAGTDARLRPPPIRSAA